MSDSAAPPPSTQPPAGFYPDGAGAMRWWDGNSWTEHTQGPPESRSTASFTGAEPKRKKRVFLWVFMVVQVLFLIWVIGGASTGSGQPTDCGVLDAETCNDASDIGTGIGVAFVIAFWAIVDIILGITYGIYRLTKRN